MSILDKKYKMVQLDINEKVYNENSKMLFSISDNQTSDFYLLITKNLVPINLKDYSTVLWITKPDKTTLPKTILQEQEDGLFYCDLEDDLKDQVGRYFVQAFIENPDTLERVVTLGEFSYDVLDDILNQRKDPDSSGNINIEYNADTGIVTFDCEAQYNADTGIVNAEV